MRFLLHTDLKQNYINRVDGTQLTLRGDANYLQFADGSYGMNFSTASSGDATTRLRYAIGATPGREFRQGYMGARLKAKRAFTPGMSGPAPTPFGTTRYYDFDGTAKHVDSPSSALPTTGDFSLSVFVRFNAFSIVAGQGTPYLADGNGILFLAAAGGVIRFTINTGSGTQLAVDGATVPLNQWVHLGVSVDRDGNAIVYVNGVAGAPVDISSKSAALGTAAIRLGRQGSAGAYANARMFGFKIFNSALAPSAFAALAANGLNGTTGNILDWTLQDTDPTTTPDASGEGRTGNKVGGIDSVNDATTPTGGFPTALNASILTLQDNAAISDAFQWRYRYDTSTFNGQYFQTQRAASVASVDERGLANLTLADDQEYHAAVRWFVHPNDPDGAVTLHFFLNGRCVNVVRDYRTVEQLPQQVTDIYIAGFNDSGNFQADHVMQDVVVCSGYVSDRDILLMATGKFDYADGYRASKPTLKKPSVRVTEIDRTAFTKAMRFYDKWDQSLWAAEREFALSTDKSKMYQTYDLTGQTGWVLRFTTPGEVPMGALGDMAANKNFRFIGTTSAVYRSPRANYTWTKVLDLDGGNGGNKVVPGWGLDAWNNYIVAGEYRVPATEAGLRVLVSADNGDSWATRLTLPASPTSANIHIHAVAFDPYTGWLWCSYGDSIDQIGYSKDYGVTWTWLFGEGDHQHQGLGFAFTERYVVCGMDSLNGQNLLVFDKRAGALHPWTGPAETGGTFFNKNCFFAGAGGGAYAAAGWGLTQFDDQRILVNHFNENVSNRRMWDAIFDPELAEHEIIRDDIITYDDAFAIFTVGNNAYFAGRYRVDLDASVGVPLADSTQAKLDESSANAATAATQATNAAAQATTAATEAAAAHVDAATAATEIGKVHRSATPVAAGAAMRRTKAAATASILDETVGPVP